jgi:FXSXX-COOH protein
MSHVTVAQAVGGNAKDIADLRDVPLDQLPFDSGSTELVGHVMSARDGESRVPVAMFNSAI